MTGEPISAQAAWRQSKRVRDLEGAQERLRGASIPRPEVNATQFQEAAYSALLAGDDPLEALEPLRHVEQLDAAHERIKAVLKTLRERVRYDVETARSNATGAALAWLQERLVVDVLHPLPEVAKMLDGISDADDAIAAGSGAAGAWAQLAAMARTHEAIRSSQETVVRHYGRTASLIYTEVEKILREHGVVQRGLFRAASVSNGGLVAEKPAYSAVPTWPAGFGADLLLWVARTDATLWVPQIDELIEAFELHRAAEHERRAAANPDHRPMVSTRELQRELEQQRANAEVRAEYERQTGRPFSRIS